MSDMLRLKIEAALQEGDVESIGEGGPHLFRGNLANSACTAEQSRSRLP